MSKLDTSRWRNEFSNLLVFLNWKAKSQWPVHLRPKFQWSTYWILLNRFTVNTLVCQNIIMFTSLRLKWVLLTHITHFYIYALHYNFYNLTILIKNFNILSNLGYNIMIIHIIIINTYTKALLTRIVRDRHINQGFLKTILTIKKMSAFRATLIKSGIKL